MILKKTLVKFISPILSLTFSLTFAVTFLLMSSEFVLSGSANAFPENVRYGYASCATCHVSPTGGGALTAYGRGASEEFMGTWSRKGENEWLNGVVTPPEWLVLGGDFRALAFTRDTKAFKDRAAFPMQADVEVGAKVGVVTVVGTFGGYDSEVQSQRHYILANIGENFFARVGRFFPAYGIYTPEHSIPTRRGLGFNEGRETYNAEIGVMGETGEIIVDGILKTGQEELTDQEKGFTARAAWYAGGKSQVGVSFLQGRGNVWNRDAYGAFAVAGLTKNIYILSELDREVKRAINRDDESTKDNTRVVTYNKIGWELAQGVHLFSTYEASVPTKGRFNPRESAYGPGIQWLPRPHFELVGQALSKRDETWSKENGYLLTLMGHYYM